MKMTAASVLNELSISSIKIIDVHDFIELALRFSLNTLVIILLVRWLYYSTCRRKDFLFTFILIATVVFLLCFLLESVKLQIGFALGLFAIFGIIRYRTDAIPIKEMTYLFIVIGVSVINALTSTGTSLVDLIFTNAVIILITAGLEKLWLLKSESQKVIIYEKIELIKPVNREELIRDISERTGIKKINRLDTGKIDFLKDTCIITIYYDSNEIQSGAYDQNGNGNDDDDD